MVESLGYVNSYELPINENPVVINALKNGIGDKIESMLKDGIFDLNTGEKLCDGIAKIGKILPNTEDQKNFSTYLVALRAIEVAEKGMKTGMSYDDSKLIVEKFSKDPRMEEGRKIYQNFHKAILNQSVKAGLYSQEDVDLMESTWINYAPLYRVMDNEGKGNSLIKNPIKRFKGSERDIINPLEGTVIMLSRIYPAIQRNATIKSFVELGETTGLGGLFYDIIPTPTRHIATAHLEGFKKELERQGIDTEKLDLEKTYEIYFPDTRDNKQERITSYKSNGKEITLQFRNDDTSKELYKVFTGGYSHEAPKALGKFLKSTASLFRYGTTLVNPKFIVNNISSDTQQASIYAKGNFIPYVDSINGVVNVLIGRGLNIPTKLYDKLTPEMKEKINNMSDDSKQKIRQMYALYKQSGASGGTMTSLYTSREQSSSQIADILNSNYKDLGLKKNKFKRFKETITLPSEISEEATRFQVFLRDMEYLNKKDSLKFNENLIDSAYNTRNATQDFSTGGGGTIKKITPYVPYLNAKVGSVENFRILAKQALGESSREGRQAFQDSIFRGESQEQAKKKKHKAIAKSLAKRIIMSAFYTTIGFLLTKAYKDNKEYEEINPQKKYNNYYIKIGGSWIKIKKPQGAIRTFINLGEYLGNLTSGNYEGKEGNELISLIWNIIQDMGVSENMSTLFPPWIATIFELGSNYDVYYGTKIVPESMMENYEPKDWYDENTSELSKSLGKIFNISPMHLDYFIKNALGTTYYDIWKAPDKLLGYSDSYASNTNTSGGAFVVNPYSSSNSVNELYDRYSKLKRKSGSGTLTDDEIAEYETISSKISSLTKINKQIKSIKADLTLSSKSKEEKIIELQKQRTDAARQALGKDLINSENSSKIEATKFYPSTSALSLNNYKLTLTEDMKKEYEQLAYSQYQKYINQKLYSKEYLEKLEEKCKDYAKKSLMQKYKNQLEKSK